MGSWLIVPPKIGSELHCCSSLEIIRDYRRLPEITGDYQRLLEITRDYQEITGDYQRLLEITRDYQALLEITAAV